MFMRNKFENMRNLKNKFSFLDVDIHLNIPKCKFTLKK